MTFDEQFFALVVDAAPDGMLIVDRSGEIVFTNHQASVLFACGQDDLIGLSVDDLVPDALRAGHRAHRTRYYADPQVRPMGLDMTLKARRRTGDEFPVEISLSPVASGGDVFVVAAVRDITARMVIHEELQRVLRTLDATEDGVFIFAADSLQFSFVNAGASRQVGYSVGELLDMTPLHINPALTESELRALLEPLILGETDSVSFQTTHLHKNGADLPVEMSVQMAPSSLDSPARLIAIGRDISARLEAEDRLRQSQLALRDAEQVLAVADDRERIARDLHDTVIQRLFAAGLSLQATATLADPEVRERIEATVDDLDQTIRDVRTAVFSLQASRPDERGLRGLVLDVAHEARETLGFEPRVQFDGPVETIDEVIAEQLIPVLREGLSNVAKHAQATEVRVSLSVTDRVGLLIADNGIGAPDSAYGGNGLPNLQSRAHDMGGSFDLSASEGGGSVFRWSVPANAAVDADSDSSGSSGPGNG